MSEFFEPTGTVRGPKSRKTRAATGQGGGRSQATKNSAGKGGTKKSNKPASGYNNPFDNDERQNQPMTLAFEDNQLALALFGDHDRNLARIEQSLGLAITSRGNQITILGGKEEQDIAKQALITLYKQLQKGHDASPGAVDGALRMAAARISGRLGADKPGVDHVISTSRRTIEPRTPSQKDYFAALKSSDMVFGLGAAGTGKTYIAVAAAVEALISGDVKKIILSRPAVEAGERLGFLPGDMMEKMDPYLRPLYDALYDFLPAEQVEKRMQRQEIEIAPLAFMRGRTLTDAFVIVDEAQNTTAGQMKMLLTRMGENSRMVITGDLSQIDLPAGTSSGMKEAVQILEGVQGITFVRFSSADVIRHPLVGRIIDAYDARDKAAHDRLKADIAAVDKRRKDRPAD